MSAHPHRERVHVVAGHDVGLERSRSSASPSARASGAASQPLRGVAVVVLERRQAGGAVGVRCRRRGRTAGRGASAQVVVVVSWGASPVSRVDTTTAASTAASPTPPTIATAGQRGGAGEHRRAHERALGAAHQRGGGGPALRPRVEHPLEPAPERGRDRARDRPHLALRGADHQQVGRARGRRALRRWRRRAAWRRVRTRRQRSGHLAPSLLRRHEPRRARRPCRCRVSPAVSSRELATPKSARWGDAVGVEEHVGGLDVPVDHAGSVGGGQRPAQRLRESIDLVGRRRTVAGDPVRQRAAGQVGHDEGDVDPVVQHLDELDDVRVVEPGQDLRLAGDALAGPGDLVGGAVERQPLQGHLGAIGARARSTTPMPPRPSRATRSYRTRAG